MKVFLSHQMHAKTLSFRSLLPKTLTMGGTRLLMVAFICLGLSPRLWAGDQPEVGREAAQKYFQADAERRPARQPMEHYLAIHANMFMNSQSWAWGSSARTNPGNWGLGVTYRMNEMATNMDLNLRFEFTEYDVSGMRPLKFSIMPLITFPEANSQFPLYFGAGIGPGIFFRQVDGESALALDYSLVVGARFFDVEGRMGFFLESGMKNHLQLTSDGQFNGVFLAAGTVFTF
jgi:hypothetical protein